MASYSGCLTNLGNAAFVFFLVYRQLGDSVDEALEIMPGMCFTWSTFKQPYWTNQPQSWVLNWVKVARMPWRDFPAAFSTYQKGPEKQLKQADLNSKMASRRTDRAGFLMRMFHVGHWTWSQNCDIFSSGVGAMRGLEKHGSCVWNLNFVGTHFVINLFLLENRMITSVFSATPALNLTSNLKMDRTMRLAHEISVSVFAPFGLL